MKKTQNFQTDKKKQIKQKKPKQVSIGTQTEIDQKEYVPLQILRNFSLESIAFPKIFQHSHNIFFLIIACTAVITMRIYNIYHEGDAALRENGRIGFFFAGGMIVIYGTSYLPNTILQRPHPAFWRFINTASLVWAMSLVYLNFYTQQNMREFLSRAIDPKIGPEHFGEKDYATNCELLTPDHPNGQFSNIINGVFDLYFVAHLMGWFFKMLIIRNFWLCQFQSILFEIIELSLKHWLVNFSECWWDSVILDLIIANTGGMLIGMVVMKFLKIPFFDFKMYDPFRSSKRFMQFVFALSLQNLIDLSHFFNKYTLKINENHNILAHRVFLLGFLCIPAFKEYLAFINNKTLKKLGPSAWTLMLIMCLEWLLFFRNYDPKDYEISLPPHVIIFWTSLLALIIGIFSYLFIRDMKRNLDNCKKRK